MALDLKIKLLRNYILTTNLETKNYISITLYPQEDTFSAEEGPDIALILDNSGSMAGEPIRNVIEAASRLAMALTNRDRLTVISFSDEARVVVPLSCGGDFKAFHPISSYEAYKEHQVQMGGTSMYEGLRVAAEELRKKRKPGRFISLILFTDGMDLKKQKTLNLLQNLNQEGFTLNCLGFGDYDIGYLESISSPMRGVVRHIEQFKDIPVLFQEFLNKAQKTIATKIQLELKLDIHERLLESYTVFPELRSHPVKGEKGTWRFTVDNLVQNQELRLFFVVVHYPLSIGEKEAGEVKVIYDIPSLGKYGQSLSKGIKVTYTDSLSNYNQVNSDRTLLEDEKNVLAESTRVKAEQAIKSGDKTGAKDILFTQQELYKQLGDRRRFNIVQQTRQRLEHGDIEGAQKILWGTRQRSEN